MSDPTADPRYTSLRARHEALGASFTDFGGWMMPVRYTSDLAEHHAVRTAAGLFDISHMAEFIVEGDGAGAFLDYALAGRLSTMPVGKAKYSLVLAASGGIVDDVIVYRLDEGWFLVISNAGNREAVATALAERAADFAAIGQGVAAVEDASDSFALIAVQGPVARQIVEATPGIEGLERALTDVPYYAAVRGEFGGEALLIARTGYTGEDGYELMIPVAAAGALWDALLDAGAPLGLVPAGLAARDTLRLEAGMPLYGHELSLDIVPAQAGLGRVVAIDKGEFVGKAGLASVVAADAPVLVGLVADGKRAGRAGYEVYAGDERVGEITSGALSPTLQHPIAMAFVSPAHSAPGTDLTIDVRGTRIPATVATLPFYKRNAK
ncbi:glycine cleavage system aminomethyltransferase GcvT [Microbacterium fluvii]|uniref:Aminomethyltransferase n=1 Tax=Microbacterium fluvii TaxID=415215 RepID=A0ABW2HGR3_9MICO|nr:glycine cleavage system aminomethyltransferase GcvT [Microbacterium fluvii]MCU4672278.1 glycine cleavage system aminomethyltransferase GcvT [Microbacterium fluvii]